MHSNFLNDIGEEVASRRPALITQSNSEWIRILELQSDAKRDFNTYGWITSPLFDEILDWKLDQQKGRTKKHREGNTPELIKEITGTFWRVNHEDPKKHLSIRLKILMAIPGVGIGVASAVLALTFPREYGVIDFRVWNVLYKEDKRTFSLKDYICYIDDIRILASRLGCDAQEIDYILWTMGNKITT